LVVPFFRHEKGKIAVFEFFGFKKRPVIEDVEPRTVTPEPKPVPMTFDEAFAAQAQAASAVKSEAEQKANLPPSDASSSAVPTEAIAASDSVSPGNTEESATEESKVPAQMETMRATAEDVIAAYKIFLGRVPESMDVVTPRVGQNVGSVLVDFLTSKEFLDQAPRAQLVLAVAKKILDERKQNQDKPPETAT
jgi:hypothetical protein